MSRRSGTLVDQQSVIKPTGAQRGGSARLDGAFRLVTWPPGALNSANLLVLATLHAEPPRIPPRRPVPLSTVINAPPCQRSRTIAASTSRGYPRLCGSRRSGLVARHSLAELIINALRYSSPTTPRVWLLRAIGGEGGVLLRISDSGLGMTDADLAE